MYKVKIVGTYVARSGVMEQEKIKKNYEIEGNIPSMANALSVVKNKLLAAALAKKYADYVTFLTYHIVEITPLTLEAQSDMGKVEIKYMGRRALLSYIKEHALKVDPAYYPNLFKLREAVQLAKEDPVGYAKQFALREPDLRLDLEMAACNPELFEEQEPAELVASVASNSIPAAKQKVSSPAVLAKKTGDRLSGLAADQVRDGDMGPGSDEAIDL
jgi:hypothetical protein